jgi:cholesterol transport system auxiliary component
MLACMLALPGCAALLPQTPNAIYDLSAPGDVAATGGGSLQLLVPEPSAIAALNTNRIAARPAPDQYAYLPEAQWSDQLPKLLQARLMATLQNTGRIRAAALPGQGLLIDYQLVIDIRAFELREEGAVAEFAVKLMDDTNGRVVRSRIFRHAVPVAAATDNASIVAGLDAAMDAAFTDIAGWALGRIA